MYFFKKIIFTIILGIGFLIPIQSQKTNLKDLNKHNLKKTFCDTKRCRGQNTINFSTGINGSGNILPFGTVDPEWQVVNKPPVTSNNYHSSITIPKAYVIKPYQNNWNTLGGAGILSPANVSNFGSNNKFTSHPWRVRRSFCVCEDSKISFKGEIKADDKGALVLYNSSHVEIFRITTSNTNSFQNSTSYSEVHHLPAGSYYLEFELLNLHGVATGFAVSGNMIASNRRVLINGSSSCCPTGSIIVQKIIEGKESCNGKLDGNDKPASGWTFTLLNKSGQPIKTGVTNQNGEVTFSGLSQGMYTVKEGNKNGFYAKHPSSGSMKFKIKPNGVHFATFYNCQKEEPNLEFAPCCPPISKGDLSKMLFISGNNNAYNPSFILSNEFKQRIQAYSNYAMSLDPCLTNVTIEYVLRRPNILPDNFNLAPNTLMSRGATVFNKDQTITTWGASTLSDTTLQGNKWYRLEIVLYGGGNDCPRWNLAKGCTFPKLVFNLMSTKKVNRNSIKGVGATIK